MHKFTPLFTYSQSLLAKLIDCFLFQLTDCLSHFPSSDTNWQRLLLSLRPLSLVYSLRPPVREVDNNGWVATGDSESEFEFSSTEEEEEEELVSVATEEKMDGVEKIEANEMNGLFGFGFTGSSTTTTGDSVLNDPGM
jgi:PHD/YefM family antitoxin component YafN of YafNO toxin-antitoxin module